MNNTATDMITPSLPKNDAIYGVEFKLLKSHGDERGFFREILRFNDPIFAESNLGQTKFGQWSHSRMVRNVVKAWHYHHLQFDWWYVPMGQIETVLYDNREESPTYKTKLQFKMGDSDKYGADVFEICVRIPPGVLHGCQVLSSEAHLFYITSETYNPGDEGRFPYNSDLVPHKWPEPCLTAENDRKLFRPLAARKPI